MNQSITRFVAMLALICLPILLISQNFQRQMGTTLDNYFSKIIQSGSSFYVLGQNQPTAGQVSLATVSRLNSSGVLQWTRSLDPNQASVWNDAVLTPSGSLLMVGTTQTGNHNTLALITAAGTFTWVRSYNYPGLGTLSRIVRSPAPQNAAFPYYILGRQANVASGTTDDVILLNMDESGVFNWKKVFFSAADDEFWRDLEVLPNGDLVIAGQMGNQGVIFKADNTGTLYAGSTPEIPFDWTDVALAGGDNLYAVGGPTMGFLAHLVKFNVDLIPIWETTISGLSAINQVWRDPISSDVFVTGTGEFDGKSRAVILRFVDGGSAPVLLWMKYLGQGETAYSGGSAWSLSGDRIGFVDARVPVSGGFGALCAFISVSGIDLTPSCMTVESTLTTEPVSLLYNGPILPEIIGENVPVPTAITSSAITWEQADACAIPCNAAFTVQSTGPCGQVTLTNTSTGVLPISNQWSNGATSANLNLVLPCGPHTWCLSITDATGCMSSFCQTFTVTETVKPTIMCPPNTSVNCDDDAIPAITGTATATDNCPGTITISYTDMVGGVIPCDASIMRTWLAVDACGNSSTCKQSILVLDNVPPVITNCPLANQTSTDFGQCYYSGSPYLLLATDNCDPSPTISCTWEDATGVILPVTPNTQFPKGTYKIRCKATDKCGNMSAVCIFTLTVVDGWPPTIVCPPSQTVFGIIDTMGNCKAVVNGLAPTVTDNCPMWSVSHSINGGPQITGDASGTMFMNGVSTVVYTVTDMGGNQVSCSFTITVNCDCPCPDGAFTGPNLVENPAFSAGDIDFSSDYSFSNNLVPEGLYWVGPNPQLVHPTFVLCGDHTTGTGNMMVVNGATTAGQNVWCQTINVLPNMNYQFCTWVASVLGNNPAYLQFSINGVNLGGGFQAQTATCNWQQFSQTWFSGSSTTTATICIVNQNTIAGGNDFALDDISFRKCSSHQPPKCDSISAYLIQLIKPPQCCFQLHTDNLMPNCFTEIQMTLSSGNFYGSTANNGWILNVTGTGSTATLTPPGGGFIPVGSDDPLNICNMSGGNPHILSVKFMYGTPPQQQFCEKTLQFDCIMQPVPDHCPANIVVNDGFTDITPPGGYGADNWFTASGTPQYAVADFCGDPGSTQIWGNRDVGESICQTQTPFYFQQGRSYNIQFCGRFLPMPNLPANFVQFGFSASNGCDPTNFNCISSGNCTDIGSSVPITSAFWGTYTIAKWTAPANFTTLNIRAFNNTPNAGPTSVSWGRIDNICIEEMVMDSCICKVPSSVSITSSTQSVNIDCATLPLYILPCEPGPVTITSDFGCVFPNGIPCVPIDWQLFGPNGLYQNGVWLPGSNLNLTFPAGSFSSAGGYTFYMTSLCPGAVDSCKCVVNWIQECPPDCVCKLPSTVSVTTAGASYNIDCALAILPILPCATGLVTITTNFGCTYPNGTTCADIDWQIFGPNGFYMNGVVPAGVALNLTFPALNFSQQGNYQFYMATLCPGAVDSCICVVDWIQECLPDCDCGSNPFNMAINYGGANLPVQCGDVVNLTSNLFVFNTTFQCTGNGCSPNPIVDWVLNGPNGFPVIGGALSATPGFIIPPLSPANWTIPGMYTLSMIGYCNGKPCPCVVKFCLSPPPPVVHDSIFCRTQTSAYIPLTRCPTIDCPYSQVRWFVKTCTATSFPTTPYQVSSGGTCASLLLLPYQYPGETCVQVYAELTLDGTCCVTQLISNTATIWLCDPVSCSISNNNGPYCDTGTPTAMQVAFTNVAPCTYTVQWYHDGALIPGATGFSYTPPVLTFPSNLPPWNCYYDHEFKVVLTGPCGPQSCSTTIRIYNSFALTGFIDMVPFEPQPFCPGEDATLEYTDFCAEPTTGPPSVWDWELSTVSGTSGFNPIPGSGTMDPVINTNKLWQTTWYKVIKQNGNCPADEFVFQIEVKDHLAITGFTAVPDACADVQVTLTLAFTPSPITGTNTNTGAPCLYEIDWYKDGVLIHTSTSSTSSVSYIYPSPNPGTTSVAGVYYAVVRDNCCQQAAQSLPVIIDPTCWPVISGPCYRCDTTSLITLTGAMVLPPKATCPSTVGCTYQWYHWNGTAWMLLPGETSLTLMTTLSGDFKLESDCGGCIRSDVHFVVQCIKVPTLDFPVTAVRDVQIRPNPTTDQVTIQVAPAPLRNGLVQITDITGRILIAENFPPNQDSHSLSIGHLPTGLYFVQIFDNGVLVWMDKIVRGQ